MQTDVDSRSTAASHLRVSKQRHVHGKGSDGLAANDSASLSREACWCSRNAGGRENLDACALLCREFQQPGCSRWRRNTWVEMVLSIVPFPRTCSDPFSFLSSLLCVFFSTAREMLKRTHDYGMVGATAKTKITWMPTRVRSHTKINLGLAIGPLRPDGFHQLTTVYQTLALHEVVTVEARMAAATRITLTQQPSARAYRCRQYRRGGWWSAAWNCSVSRLRCSSTSTSNCRCKAASARAQRMRSLRSSGWSRSSTPAFASRAPARRG